ncbi:hypothetical protein D9M69_417280 [compost metagenome]
MTLLLTTATTSSTSCERFWSPGCGTPSLGWLAGAVTSEDCGTKMPVARPVPGAFSCAAAGTAIAASTAGSSRRCHDVMRKENTANS